MEKERILQEQKKATKERLGTEHVTAVKPTEIKRKFRAKNDIKSDVKK